MADARPDNAFYTQIAPQEDFAALASSRRYTSLPDDWWVGTSDIVASTRAVEQGLYKTVNMVAAAVISAQINCHGRAAFPYIFGGDGAHFSVPPAWKDRAGDGLASVRTWAREEFGLELRVAMATVGAARAAGHDVAVARFRPSPGVDYAMFTGGGLSWAEDRMKAGNHGLPAAAPGTRPDLTGLSCRWSHMPSRHGEILSIVIQPAPGASRRAFARVARQVSETARGLDRAGHPSAAEGPGVSWPPKGATLEAHAQRGDGSLAAARGKALFESLVAWILIRSGLKLGGFDARRYRRIVGDNADFRKYEDGLKMTLDCDADTRDSLKALLEAASKEGVVEYGLWSQSEAMMTCIVPSIQSDDHVHFVDGAGGGYTAAAQQIKSRAG